MNQGAEVNLYYWRDKTGREIDLLIDETNRVIPVEIKAGKTIHNEFFKNIRYWMKLTGEKSGKVIYAGDSDQNRSEGIEIISWKNINKIFNTK